jgi:hypothetical protein
MILKTKVLVDGTARLLGLSLQSAAGTILDCAALPGPRAVERMSIWSGIFCRTTSIGLKFGAREGKEDWNWTS